MQQNFIRLEPACQRRHQRSAITLGKEQRFMAVAEHRNGKTINIDNFHHATTR